MNEEASTLDRTMTLLYVRFNCRVTMSLFELFEHLNCCLQIKPIAVLIVEHKVSEDVEHFKISIRMSQQLDSMYNCVFVPIKRLRCHSL